VFCCGLGIISFWVIGFVGHQLTKNWHEE